MGNPVEIEFAVDLNVPKEKKFYSNYYKSGQLHQKMKALILMKVRCQITIH